MPGAHFFCLREEGCRNKTLVTNSIVSDSHLFSIAGQSYTMFLLCQDCNVTGWSLGPTGLPALLHLSLLCYNLPSFRLGVNIWTK